jgi:hypothetical protein
MNHKKRDNVVYADFGRKSEPQERIPVRRDMSWVIRLIAVLGIIGIAYFVNTL